MAAVPRGLPALVAGAMAAIPCTSVAADAGGAATIAPKDVCVGGHIDREKLLQALVTATGMDKTEGLALIRAEIAMGDDPAARSAFAVIRKKFPQFGPFAELADAVLRSAQPAGAAIHATEFLTSATPPTVPCPPDAITAPNSKGSLIVAKPDQPGAPPAAPEVGSQLLASLRVRGSPDDLVYSPTSSQFASASKLTLSYGYSGASKSTSFQVTGAVGPALPVGEMAVIVPYVAAVQNLSRTPGKPDKKSADDYEVGGEFAAEVGGAKLGQAWSEWILAARPHYVFNQVDGSRLAAIRFSATPYISGVLNDWFNLGGVNCEIDTCPLPSIEPLLALQAYAGGYTVRGHPLASAGPNLDYARLGAKVGLAVHYTKWFDASVTDSLLYGASGALRRQSYLQSSMTLNLDDQKRFGLTGAYTHGRVEDTAVENDTWTMGLSARY
jgi:hypothetical protein